MTADARAYAWCNLGPLAPGETSIGDDHLQGTGLCMTKGTIRLLGVVRPAAGTVVELAYSDGQSWLARLPRRLRVLSSFTNPLGAAITTISVGCDLAYSESRKPVVSNPTNQQANPTVPEVARRAASPPIPATWLVDTILQAIGITAAGACPLTNHYNRDEFDMGEGYVQELGKLLASEGYFARMNEAGLLQYISKDSGLQASTVLLEDDLIEINPINSGELPGDAVYAKYTSIKLKAPGNLSEGELAKRNWESDKTISAKQVHIHNWTKYERTPVRDANGNVTYKQSRDRNGNLLYYVADGAPVTEIVYETKAMQIKEYITYRTITETTTYYDSWDRVASRKTETYGLYGYEKSETAYIYKIGAGGNKPANYSDVLTERTQEFSARGPLAMQLGAQGGFYEVGGFGYGPYGQPYLASIREVSFDKNQQLGISKTLTSSRGAYITTTYGSESISRMKDAGASLQEMLGAATALVDTGSSVSIRTEREYGLQKRPAEADRLADANRKAPEVEEVVSLVWQLGSPASLTSIELSPPYVPDDRLSWNGSTWAVTPSDAPQKALNFARIENRLRLGHRNGNGLQLLPEQVPPQPFGLVFIRLAGCTGAYRLNGTTYTISPEGCVATTDAVFWGGIDAAAGATPWFPMPPASAALPAPIPITTNPNPRPANAIAIPQGFNLQAPNLTSLFAMLPTNQSPTWARSLNPSILVRPYRETLDLDIGMGAGVLVEAQSWIPEPVTDLLVGIGAGLHVSSQATAGIGAGVLISVNAQAPVMAPLLASIPSSAEILDQNNFEWLPGSSQYGWAPAFDPQNIATEFLLNESIVIVAVGIYDHGQNGLAEAHGFTLYSQATPTAPRVPITLNYGGGTQQITIPSGTTGALQSGYRIVALTSPQTLAAGRYTMLTTMPTSGLDPIAAIGIGAGNWNSTLATGSNAPLGLAFPYDSGTTPQVIDASSFDDYGFTWKHFQISGGNNRVPIGPMLFVNQ